MLIYTLSTPLSSEVVNFSSDPAPHEFSTGKSENVHSTFPYAGTGQCRAAVQWQMQGREAAGQAAPRSRLSLCRGHKKIFCFPSFFPGTTAFIWLHGLKIMGNMSVLNWTHLFFFVQPLSNLGFPKQVAKYFCGYFSLFCSSSLFHNIILIFKRDTFFFVLDPKKLFNLVGLHGGCKRFSLSRSA